MAEGRVILGTSSSMGEEDILRTLTDLVKTTRKLLPMYKAKWSMKSRKLKKGLKHVSAVITMIVSCQFGLQAQDGMAGINEANTKVRGYFAVGCNLMYAVGAILGLIGAIRVYQKWVGGHQETGQVAAAWFGSCVFLVIVATVLKSFFGI